MHISDPSIDLPRILARERSRTDDSSALEAEVLALFDTFREPLLRYVSALGVTASDGEDVVQDVFLALFTHLRRDGARSNLRGWLFRVAHNLALRKRMQRQRERDRFSDNGREAHYVLDRARDPETALADRQQRQRTHAVLEALPARERDCLALRSSGLRYREIAHVLGISLGAVAKSMARAIARLQRSTEG